MRSGSQGVRGFDLVVEHSAQRVDWRARHVLHAPSADPTPVQLVRLRIGGLALEDDGPEGADPRRPGA